MPTSKQDPEIGDVLDAVRLLVMIELCKAGASREEVRDVLGSMDNNAFARVNQVMKRLRRTNHSGGKGSRS